jgi:hypothetical protein
LREPWVELFGKSALLLQQGGYVGLGRRPPDQESLRGIASRLDQHRLCDTVLQAFPYDPQSQVVTETDR